MGSQHFNIDFNVKSSFTGRSVEDGLPVTLPLRNLEDLLTWKPNDPDDAGQIFSVGTVPYLGKEIPKESTKSLVCHDMAGGYLDDRFVQGKLCLDDKWYYLVYWDIVDTFVYFSHHFITIPPVGWINSAHTNGVAVLGTFITEAKDGYKRCEAIFLHEFIWKKVADQLVEISKYYKFEGWLLNIENKINKNNVESVRSFVKYLTDKMHDAIEGSQVIWYDSITIEGDLAWQNELNHKNKTFFDACDGIFLNYGWDKVSLERSAETALVEKRVTDVYVGVDVFGRGSYGGGGMNCSVALEVIRRYNLSAAIFAPGWVKEVLGTKNFEANQRKFWTKLSTFCNTHSIIGDPMKPVLISTDFNPGIMQNINAKHRFLHLNRQELMPCLSDDAFSPLMVTGREGPPYEIAIRESNIPFSLFKSKFSLLHNNVLVYAASDKELKLTLKVGYYGINQVYGINPCCGLITTLQSDEYIAGVECCPKNQAKVSRFLLYCSEMLNFPQPVRPYKSPRIGFVYPAVIKSQPQQIDVKLEDRSWKKCEDIRLLQFSGTVDLSNFDVTRCIDVSYKTLDDEYIDLGVSRCKKYRIHDMYVPNPLYHGSEAKFTIKAEQKSLVDPLDDPDFPMKFGELVVSYGENMPAPLETE